MPEVAIEIANCTPETNDKLNCPSFHYAAALCSHAAAIHLPAAITRIRAVQPGPVWHCVMVQGNRLDHSQRIQSAAPRVEDPPCRVAPWLLLLQCFSSGTKATASRDSPGSAAVC